MSKRSVIDLFLLADSSICNTDTMLDIHATYYCVDLNNVIKASIFGNWWWSLTLQAYNPLVR